MNSFGILFIPPKRCFSQRLSNTRFLSFHNKFFIWTFTVNYASFDELLGLPSWEELVTGKVTTKSFSVYQNFTQQRVCLEKFSLKVIIANKVNKLSYFLWAGSSWKICIQEILQEIFMYYWYLKQMACEKSVKT